MVLVNRNMQPTARNLRDILGFVRDGHVDMNPPYQRGDVWTIEQRVALIKSLLLGVPVAALVLNLRDNRDWREAQGDPGDVVYAVIDGKQRLTTVQMFFGGKLAVPRNWFAPDWIADGSLAPGADTVTWSHFERHAQLEMGLGFTVPVAEAKLGSLAEEAEVYGLINSAGTAHTENELATAREIARRKS